MTSLFRKKMALARIRQLLFQHNLNQVSARNSFPNYAMNEVKWLKRLGAIKNGMGSQPSIQS
jgi:hypothetical protein